MNLVFLEISVFLVSIGSNLAQFGVMVVEISLLEGRWRSLGNSATFFLKNSFLSICGSYHWAFFVGGIRDIILQSCLDRLPQLLFSWYNFLHENGQKTTLLTWEKKVKHLIRVSKFYWYLICFNFDFGPWTFVSKGKIWPTRWSKI